ncbi:fumarylacetoacetate hydrolase family protein [Piscinibacter sp.]|uniref:fumarylacetoacetate hydrolase family protein n=1 Tax=Piscinibacter sp. TaxID=1903157 RepID=UPI00355A19AD
MFTLSTVVVSGKSAPLPVIGLADRFWALEDVAPQLLQPQPLRGLMNVFEDWGHADGELQRVAAGLADGEDAPTPVRPEAFLAPLQYPNKLLMVGANYYDHIHGDAGRTDFRKELNNPVFFLKPPSTSLVGSEQRVRYPKHSDKLDYEIELALVIGKRARRVSVGEAMEHVAGYSVALDLSARDWQRDPRHMVKFDLFSGKVFDDSCPMGPNIVPARYVDAAALPLKLWVNGELRQDGSTRDMVWSIPELLAELSERVTLEPGDVVCTGTPAGVGLRTGTYLIPGDVVDAEIGPLGHLRVVIGERA